jgi:hypothetical protein
MATKTKPSKKLSLKKQAELLLESPKNLKDILDFLLEYGTTSDESLELEDMDLDCFCSKQEYARLKNLSQEELEDAVDEGSYLDYVMTKHASILETENWYVLTETLAERVRKAILKG